MRLTILAPDFPPVVGGIADHTDRMAVELAGRGLDVTVVCPGPAAARAAFGVQTSILRRDRVARVAAAVAATEPDVICWQYNPFAAGRHGLAGGAGRLARALARRAPLVLYAHELWFPLGRAGLRGFAWALAQRVQTRIALRAASAVVVTTDARRREAERSARVGVRVIPVGPSILPVAEANGARASLGLPADAFVVAHLGGVGPGHDIATAFGAVAELRARGLDARLVLAGRTGPFVRPEALNGAVVTTGIMPHERLSSVLATADAYLHVDPAGPSAGRRTTLVAALAHGLPVVAFRGPDGAPELEHGRNVVLVDHDARAVAGALETIARDEREARRLGDAAYRTYTNVFSWLRIGDTLAEVLRGCAR